MSATKPLIQIKDFTQMSSKGGIYFTNGMTVKKENGISMIRTDFSSSDLVTNTGTYSSLTNLDVVYIGVYNALLTSNKFILFVDSGGNLYTKNIDGSFYNGKVGNIDTANTTPIANTSILSLPSGNMLITSSNYAAKIIRGACASGSSTVKIVDKQGRNFSTLGVSTSSPNNKVRNIYTGDEFTITNISTTSSTNDTLEFSAGAYTNTVNDEFIVVLPEKIQLNTAPSVPHFFGQPETLYWSRKTQQFGEDFFILNGNYISILAGDEITIDNEYKKLPAGYQALDFSFNGGKVLVSAVSTSNKNYLLLWDGHAQDWNWLKEVDYPVYCLTNYNSGWLYMSQGSAFYTDGYGVKTLSTYVDNKTIPDNDLNPNKNNTIIVSNNNIYFTYQATNYNRIFPGIYCLTENGWCYVYTNKMRVPYSLTSYNNKIYLGTSAGVSSITATGANSLPYYFQYLVDVKEDLQIKGIDLDISCDLDSYIDDYSDVSVDVEVNIANLSKGFTNLMNVTIPTTTTMQVDGTVRGGEIGNEVMLLNNGFGGERTYITAIANKGLVNETWTVSPAISGTTGSTVSAQYLRVKNIGKRTVNIKDLNKMLRFITAETLTNKFIIEVIIKNQTLGFPIGVTGINIY